MVSDAVNILNQHAMILFNDEKHSEASNFLVKAVDLLMNRSIHKYIEPL